MQIIKQDTVIIGAGLAGLSFAYHYDRSLPIYESLDVVGGLVRTIDEDGYKFDLAPHLLHLRNPYVRELVFDILQLQVDAHVRKAHIFYDQAIIPYPFELNLFGLSEQTKRDCLEGLKEVKSFSSAEEQDIRKGSYQDYALRVFGKGISEHYLIPYNRKIWDTDPREMTCEFMGHLPTADKEQIIKNAGQPNMDKFGYNTEFYYPNIKGIQDLADVFANQLSQIKLNTTVTRFETKKKTIYLSDGNAIVYNKLVSTVPLKSIIENSDLEHLKEVAAELSFTSVYTVNIVIQGTVPDTHWMYFPDKNLSFYRISFPKNYFKKATPHADEHIIAVEVGSRNHSINIKDIEIKVVEEIKAMPIFTIHKIVKVKSIKIPVAYCIYEPQRPPLVKKLMDALQSESIYQIGRYGQWEYAGMQDAIMNGKTLSDKLKAENA